MKRVFLDTNVLLDYGLDRELADYAEAILALGKQGYFEICAFVRRKPIGCRITNEDEGFRGHDAVSVCSGSKM